MPQPEKARAANTTAAVVILGATTAALLTALHLSPRPVSLVVPQFLEDAEPADDVCLQDPAATAEGRSASTHLTELIANGDGLTDEAVARFITGETSGAMHSLARFGITADLFARDETTVWNSLLATVRATPTITLWEGYIADELMTMGDGPARRAAGLYLSSDTDPAARYKLTDITAIVLATGGIGGLYSASIAPSTMRGSGIAVAARAGAQIADAEFIDFHPTAVARTNTPCFIAPIKLLRHGARLVDGAGRSFMSDLQTDAEPAPYPVISRAISEQISKGTGAFLDCTSVSKTILQSHFARFLQKSVAAGLDPALAPIPVLPAANHHAGGIKTDQHGRTNISGLWAVGEAASIGLHGAATSSLGNCLETIVMTASCAADISTSLPQVKTQRHSTVTRERTTHLADFGARTAGLALIGETMTSHVGVERDDAGLRQALATLGDIALAGTGDPVIENATLAARFIAEAALRRRESRGAHYRRDYPETTPAQARTRLITRAGLDLRQSLASGELFSEITAGGGTLH